MAAILTPASIASHVAERLAARNMASSAFFAGESARLATLSRDMADRFRRGGRLLAFGRRACATDAQHVAVEFVHPVIVGKRALPALDLSAAFETTLPALLRENDIVMGFSPPAGDSEVTRLLGHAASRGALTVALTGDGAAAYTFPAPAGHPWVHQEIVEIVYHTLWETVHVFLDHGTTGEDDLGASAFLYPFLQGRVSGGTDLLQDVAASIRSKAAAVEALRLAAGREQAAAIAAATLGMADRVRSGGTMIFFGNGGSATDANDWALDCAEQQLPAISLAGEPACVTAIANDIGRDAIFLRQIIAHARPGDVAVAISTSGGSANVIAALVEARRRGLATVALLGCDGGEVIRQGLADHAIVIACDYIPRIQEVQASIYHVMTEVLGQCRSEGEP